MSTEADTALIHGAMEEVKTRDLPDGALIEFEFAPAGFLKRDGEVRLTDYRAYYLTPAARTCSPCRGGGRVFDRSERGRKCELCRGTGNESRRARLPSVTTVLDAIMPKPGLPPWAEARGIEGAVQAVRDGLLDPHDLERDPVAVVRGAKLGADRARDEAAERGLNVHAVLEAYMLTGAAPNPADHPVEHHGYIRALTRWLLVRDPQPVAVEHLVASVQDGYAGRLDLRARVKDFGGELLYTFDAKTQERGQIYAGAHVQVSMYERAAVACGDEPADRLAVVVFAANGEFREMAADHSPSVVDQALAFYRAIKPIDSVCESQNRIEREARKAVPA